MRANGNAFGMVKKIRIGQSATKHLEKEDEGSKTIENFDKIRYGVNGDNMIYNDDKIITIIKTKNPDIEYLGREENNFSRIKMRCSCGKEFSKPLDKIRGDKYLLCSSCARKRQEQTRNEHERTKYLRKLKDRGYWLLDKNQILRANTFCDVEDKDGFRGMVYPNTKTPFLPFSPHHNKKYFVFNCNRLAEIEGDESRVIELIPVNESPYSEAGVKVKCSCGEIFTMTYRGFVYRGKRLCPRCSKNVSSYEIKVADYLDKLGIKYKRQFIINSCCDKRPLPFDFCLLDYNILVEVDGQQHFYPVRFANRSKESAEVAFENRKRVDSIKTKYCEQWNIPLIRISYKDILNEQYKIILSNLIQNE